MCYWRAISVMGCKPTSICMNVIYGQDSTKILVHGLVLSFSKQRRNFGLGLHQLCEDFNTLFSVSVVSFARELIILHSAGGHTKPPCTRGGNVSGPVHICHWHVSYHTFLHVEMLTAIMSWGSSRFVLHMYQDACPLSNTHYWVSSISVLCHWSLSYSIGLAWRCKFTAPHCNTNHYLCWACGRWSVGCIFGVSCMCSWN
jgi:hypothetical protein